MSNTFLLRERKNIQGTSPLLRPPGYGPEWFNNVVRQQLVEFFLDISLCGNDVRLTGLGEWFCQYAIEWNSL